ncbi:MAG TPA: hypothetical protein VGC17_02990 [Lactovum miscens]|uniref:hypothetical protein n=1 Tax=Lactovum miscens TaxID=190387 RepID=UPI002EDB6280
MKYIAKYGLIGTVAMLAFVATVPQLQLSTKITNDIIIIFGIILFTLLGALLKAKVKLGPAEKTTNVRK